LGLPGVVDPDPPPAFSVNPDPDPIRIKDFHDQILERKKIQQNIFLYLFKFKYGYLLIPKTLGHP
jgi:hypothetical protein